MRLKETIQYDSSGNPFLEWQVIPKEPNPLKRLILLGFLVFPLSLQNREPVLSEIKAHKIYIDTSCHNGKLIDKINTYRYAGLPKHLKSQMLDDLLGVMVKCLKEKE